MVSATFAAAIAAAGLAKAPIGRFDRACQKPLFAPITPPPNRPADTGCRGGSFAPDASTRPSDEIGSTLGRVNRTVGESQMPKMKTKSGAKKRFKVTGTGKVMYAQSGKRHGMIKRTKKQIRNLRGTKVLFKTDGDNVKKFYLPNG
jgi:large subunit ribosomal protein L35